METKKKIAFVDCSNPDDKRSWSGTPYNLVQQFKRFYDLDPIWVRDTWLEKIGSKFFKGIFRLMGKNGNLRLTTIFAKLKGKQVTKRLKEKKYDIVYFHDIELAAYTKTDIPKRVYFSDATFHLMVDYYLFNLTKSTIETGNKLQRRSLENCNVNVFASNWAMRDAVDYYHVPKEIAI